jgi:rhamnosyl/mannosyltransferase
MESHLQTLALAQAENGAEVHVLCVNHRGQRDQDVTWKTLAATKTVREWDGSVQLTRVGRLASLIRFDVCPRLLYLIAQLRHLAPDVLHLHVPNPTMLLALAAIRPRMPLVITYHSDVVRQRHLNRLLRPLEHFVFRRARAILAASPDYAAGSSRLRAYPERVHVVPYGINLETFMSPGPEALAEARRLQKEHGFPLWLAVGRLVYYKGLHNAIQALAEVPGRLLIVGEGPLEAELRRLAEARGVGGRVVWAGRVSKEKLVGAYLAATALWFPSNARSEAFGLVQVEAMASGCPVINTRIPVSGVSWVSRHEDTGLTVPVDDPGALVHAARRVLTEPGLRDYLGNRARQRACEEFDHRLMARRSLELYQRLLQAKALSDKGEFHHPRQGQNGIPHPSAAPVGR